MNNYKIQTPVVQKPKQDILCVYEHKILFFVFSYRKFKSITNKTIAGYFRSLRLHKAKEYLTTSGMNVSEVAYLTGFKSLAHFSRAFTRQFGINPSKIHG